MGQIYQIICPECGKKFEVMKGSLMSESVLNPIPKERQEETPFNCPNCKLQMSVKDPDFNEHVESIIMID